MASYRAAYLLANEIKPFSDGEFFRKKNLQYTVQVTCPQEINCFLYWNTETPSHEPWSDELLSAVNYLAPKQSRRILKLSLDQYDETSNAAHLLNVPPRITASFQTVEERASGKNYAWH